MPDLAIKDILYKNRKKGFVKRILNKDDYPELDNGDGSYSTHSMAYGEADGRYFVYPTIVEGEGGLQRLDGRAAFDYAMKTGEYIDFGDEEDAEWFSKNYKKYWEK